MKRITAFLFAVVAPLFATGVYASSHRAPADLSFIGATLWEIEHFVIHMGLTFEALVVMFSSPQFGWALLGEQIICATVSPIVGMLFGSALGSVLTFLVTIVLIGLFVVWFVTMLKSALAWMFKTHRLAIT